MPITCHSFGTRITFWGSAFPKFVCDGGGTNGKREKKAEECIWWVKDKSDVAWRLHGKQLASTSPPPHCFQLLRDFECWMSHWRVMSECAQKTNILNDCFILKDGTFFYLSSTHQCCLFLCKTQSSSIFLYLEWLPDSCKRTKTRWDKNTKICILLNNKCTRPDFYSCNVCQVGAELF